MKHLGVQDFFNNGGKYDGNNLHYYFEITLLRICGLNDEIFYSLDWNQFFSSVKTSEKRFLDLNRDFLL